MTERSAIADWLAGREVACPQCGYSLRDCVGERCPECGWAITARGVGMPAPTDDGESRLAEYLRTHDVKCKYCGYNLRELERGMCPECGTTYRLMGGERRAGVPKRRRPRVLNGLATLIVMAAVLVALMVMLLGYIAEVL